MLFIMLQPIVRLKAAREADKRWKSGNPLSVIDGVPTAIKDGLLMKGGPCIQGIGG